MKWVFRGFMTVSMIGGALVTAGLLPATFASVAVMVGTAAALWHDKPGKGEPAG